jgi:hypothetical protein
MKLRVGDVVDEAADTVVISNHHPAALRAEVRVVVGSVEKICDTVVGRNNAEETTHPVSLSCLEKSRRTTVPPLEPAASPVSRGD